VLLRIPLVSICLSRKSLGRSSVARATAARVASLAASVLTGVVLARALGASGRGEYAFYVLVPETLRVLFGLGLHESATVFVAKAPEDSRPIAASILVWSVGVGTCLAAAVILAPSVFGLVDTSVWPVALVGLAVPLAFVQKIAENVLRGLFDFDGYSLVVVTQSVVLTIGVVGISFWNPTSTSATAAFLVSLSVSAAVAFTRISKRWTTEAARSVPTLLEVMAFGLRAWPATILSFCARRLDFILIHFLGGAQALGFYAVATQILESTLLFPASTAAVLAPKVARGDISSEAAHVDLIRTGLGLSVATGAVVITSPWLLPLAFGSEFSQAIPPLLILAPGVVAVGLNQVLGAFLTATGRPHVNSWASLCGTTVAAILFIALIPPFGVIGAAIGSSAAYGTQFAVQIAAFRRSERCEQ